MTDWSGVLTAAGKGAALGSVVPGIGTAIGAGAGTLIGVAMNVMPGIQHLIAGNQETISKVQDVVEAVTGTADPAQAQAALDADPDGIKADLQRQLAEIASDQFKAQLADVAGARDTTVQLAKAGSPIAWGAPIISVIVLASFGAAMVLTLLRTVPEASMPVLNVLLGSLTAMATSVVSYWVGSSAGSASKDNRLANMVPASLLPKPAAIVPAADARH